ncbi:hypothetical protein ACFL0G_01885 [Candidatus Zixiibacteriota bacterium]
MSAVDLMNQDLVAIIVERLKEDGFTFSENTIDQRNVLVGKSSKFKVSWFATQLNLFAIIATPEEVSEEAISSYCTSALDHAIKHNSGLPRGMQSGVACFALMISPSVGVEAEKWIQKKSRKRFAAFAIPVLLDTSDNSLIYYKKTPILGGMYYKFFRKFVQKYFTV